MSDEESGDKPGKVGYRQPPVEHRFKKGKSGNPRGRPPKRERSSLPRQFRGDILNVAHRPMRINTPAGEREITTFEGVVMAVAKSAMKGHYSSGRLFLEMCRVASNEHYETHTPFQLLEHLEKEALIAEKTSPEEIKRLNTLRKATRRT